MVTMYGLAVMLMDPAISFLWSRDAALVVADER
jgi:hypothetical protein